MALDPATYGFLLSAALSAGVAALSVLAFSVLRRPAQHVYEYRRVLRQRRDLDDFNGRRVGVPPVLPGRGLFSWVRAALANSEDDVVRDVGLDATMYLRYLRSMWLSFGAVSLLGVVVLVPVYATGPVRFAPPTPLPSPSPGAPNPDLSVRGLRVISLANLRPNDPRFWATIVMEIFSTLVFLFFLYRDFERFAELRRRNLVAENPKNYAVAVYDIPREESSREAILARFETIVPGQIEEVIIIKNNRRAVSLHKKLAAAVRKREAAEWALAHRLQGERPVHRAGTCGPVRRWEDTVDSIDHWASEQSRLSKEVVAASESAPDAPCAIVVFKNKRAASLLVQVNMGRDSSTWNIEKMPEPKAVLWGAFNVPAYQAGARRVVVLVAVITMTLFWTIPAFGLASLVNLEALAANPRLKFLSWILQAPPALLGIIQGLLPVAILAIIVMLIPLVIRVLVQLERNHDAHVVDRKVRDYFYFFTIYGSFFCIVVGSSILEKIQEIVKMPYKLFDLLGSSIPGNGIFFANYIVVQTGIQISLDLFNPLRLGLVWFFSRLAKTERQKRKAGANGCDPDLFKRYGQVMLISFMGIMYTPLAPIVPFVSFIYFGYNYLVCRYNMLFNLYAESDGAGESYPGAFWGTLVALLLRHSVLIVLIGFKSGKAMAPFVVIPAILSIVFAVETGRRFRRVSKFGDVLDHFSTSKEIDEIPATYAAEYTQPAVVPEVFQNLNGVAENPSHFHEGSSAIPSFSVRKDIEDPDFDMETPQASEEIAPEKPGREK